MRTVSNQAKTPSETVEKAPKQILRQDAKKNDLTECATINDLIIMRGHETPENHLLTILKGFSTVSEGVLKKGRKGLDGEGKYLSYFMKSRNTCNPHLFKSLTASPGKFLFRLSFFGQLKIDDFDKAHPASTSSPVFDIEDLLDLIEGVSFFHQGLYSDLFFFDALNDA